VRQETGCHLQDFITYTTRSGATNILMLLNMYIYIEGTLLFITKQFASHIVVAKTADKQIYTMSK